MRKFFSHASVAASVVAVTALVSLPLPELAGVAHAAATPLTWSATAPIEYMPVRGAIVNAGPGLHPVEAVSSHSGSRVGASATVPGTVSITSATPGTGSVALRWTSPTTSGGSTLLGYSERYSSDSGVTWTTQSQNSTHRSITIYGLSSSLSYLFEVAAFNAIGTGAWSQPFGPVTPLSGATVPGAPTVTSVTAATNAVQVAWSAPSSNGGSAITSYSVRYSVNGSGVWTTATTTATASPYTVGSLSSSSSYIFEVAAKNSVGTGAWSAPSSAVTPLASTSNGIQYHGGPVLVNSVHIYEIWYGNWTTASTPARQSLVDTFNHGIGGTPYFNTNSSYYNASGVYVQNSVSVAGSTTVTGGSTSLSSGSISTIVANVLAAGTFPIDANAVYYVFTSRDVSVSGFLTQYCGFHSALTANSTNVQYAFVGDPTGPSVANCSAQTASSPNGDVGGDAMVSVVAHELSEATSDPQLNAWYADATGNENGDLCAWNFGAYFTAPNGSAANVTWTINGTSYNYLIQQNWVNAAGGYCALKY
jgi:hypothetical protein